MYILVIFNLIISSFLTGLIWFVQVVHYPIFRKVPASHFVAFEQTHMYTTGQVVIGPMLAELLLSIALVLKRLPMSAQALNYISFACVIVIWAVTFFISSPIHMQLSNAGTDEALINKLVVTNWIRTISWSVRTCSLAYIAYLLLDKN
jgi:hypothetical protein